MNVTDLNRQYESFVTTTEEARLLSERDVDYDNHHQWSDEEKAELAGRKQPPVVINRLKNKINVLLGMQKRTQSMPKALPRTPQHEGGANAATEALRYVVDNTDFQMTSGNVFRDEMVPGYGGVIIEYVDDEIKINNVPWDRYYYDPHSRRLDFKDKKFDGIVIWMDKDDAAQRWPEKQKDIMEMSNSPSMDETFDDKPLWVSKDNNKRERIRVCEHYYLEKGVWMRAFMTENMFLAEPAPSPYLDDKGKPCNPIEMQTAYIDRDLNRYGEARAYIWLQDEINHRRSRLLYSGYVNRTMGEDGAVDDINEMKREMAKSDGHIKTNRGFAFEVMPNDAVSEVSLLLYRESKQEIDDISANAALAGKGEARSGRQDQIQQQAGMVELASLFGGHKHWENRVYRQIWNRIRQYKNAEWWVRVTDDEENLEWVGLNQPVTNGDMLMEAAEAGNPQAAEILQGMVNDPRLGEIAEVRNNVAELDVDIILTEGPDTHTLKHEQFEILAALAERYGPEKVPFEVMLEMSDMPRVAAVKKMLNPPPDPQQQQVQELMFNLEVEGKQAEINAKNAKAERDKVETQAQLIENDIVTSGFENIVSDRDADSTAKHLDNLQKEVETMKLAEDDSVEASVSV